MKIAAFGLSDVGKVREKNEDSFLVRSDLGLVAVCDGMGGHQGGDYASQEAVDVLEETLVSIRKNPSCIVGKYDGVQEDDLPSHLRYAIKVASRKIYQKSLDDDHLRGMGTTAVVLYFNSNKVFIANVGDSRAYRMRGGILKQVTTDHSLVNEQLKAGVITEKEAHGHKLKNIITRSVGFQQDVDVDVDIRAVLPGDFFLLCSDGLTNMISDKDIEKIFKKEKDLSLICKTLIEVANQNGGDDNVTAVVARVDELDEGVGDSNDDTTVEMG